MSEQNKCKLLNHTDCNGECKEKSCQKPELLNNTDWTNILIFSVVAMAFGSDFLNKYSILTSKLLEEITYEEFMKLPINEREAKIKEIQEKIDKEEE